MHFQQYSVVNGLVSLVLGLLLLGCDTSDESDQTEVDGGETLEPTSRVFTAGIGPLAGANVLIESHVDGTGWFEEQSLLTDELGEFDLTGVSFNQSTWYRFTATGGALLDANFDGVEDDSVNFDGQLRGIALGEWLDELGGMHVGFAAETAYTDVANDLNSELIDWTEVENSLNTVAEQLLATDLNGDEQLSYLDVMSVSASNQSEFNWILIRKAQQMSSLTASGMSSLLSWMPYAQGLLIGEDLGDVYDYEVTDDLSKIYAANEDDGLTIIDGASGEISVLVADGENHTALALDETNNKLYLNASSPNAVFIVDTVTETFEESSILSDIRTYSLDVNTSGSTLYVGSDNAFYIYDVALDSKTAIETDFDVDFIRLSDDEQTLYIGAGDYAGAYNLAAESFDFYIDTGDTVYDVFLSESGTEIYIAHSSEGISIVDLVTETIESFPPQDGNDVYGIAPVYKDNLILVTTEESVFSFDLETKAYTTSRFDIEEMEDYSYDLIYLEEYDVIITGAATQVAGAYSGVNRELLVDNYDDDSSIESVLYDQDRDAFIYGISDGYIGIFNESTNSIDYVAVGDVPIGMSLSSDGATYYVPTLGAGIDLIDVITYERTTISATVDYIGALEHQASGMLYALSRDGNNYGIDVYDLDDLSFVGALDMEGCSVRDFEFNASQTLLYAACSNDGSGIRRYSLAEGSWESFNVDYSVQITLNTDETVVYASNYGTISELDIATGTVTRTFETDQTSYGLAVWPKYNALLGGGNNGLFMIDLSTGMAHKLHHEFSNKFALNLNEDAIYYGGGNDGFFKLDLSGF